jgi:hypothetical protein
VTLLNTDLELDSVFASSELARLVVSYFSRYLVPLERLSKTGNKVNNSYCGNRERWRWTEGERERGRERRREK